MGSSKLLARVHFLGEVLANILIVVRARNEDEGAFEGMLFVGVSRPHLRGKLTAYLAGSS